MKSFKLLSQHRAIELHARSKCLEERWSAFPLA
jgi:hypothetical protein